MKLYKTGELIYFEDSANDISGEWYSWDKSGFKKVSSTVIFIKLYKFDDQHFKSYVSRQYTAADIEDENGESYGSTPESVISGITGVKGAQIVKDISGGLSIAKGEVPGTSFIHKFGEAPDFDISDNFVTVWDGANDAKADANTYTFSTTNDIDSLSCSAGDTVDIEIQGLDSNYLVVTQTKTLTGQTPVSLTTNLLRVFRLKNVSSTNLTGDVYCYVSGNTVTAGVPQTAVDIRAIISLHAAGISASHNQTLMAVYTIPAAKTGYLTRFFGSTVGSVKTAVNEIHLEIRPFGQVFQTKHAASIISTGASHFSYKYDPPEIITEKSDILMEANTDVNSSGISAGFDIILVDD